MHKITELKEKLLEELADYSENGKFSKEDVESIKYLASGIDHICNILERTEYSNDGYYEGTYEGSYDGGMNRNSYARGRRNARRDSMGRYSRARGYSRAADDTVAELKELMQDAPNEDVRAEIRKLVSKIENM